MSVRQASDDGYVVAGAAYTPNGSINDYVVKADGSGRPMCSGTYGSGANSLAYSIREIGDHGYSVGGVTYENGNGDLQLMKLRKEVRSTAPALMAISADGASVLADGASHVTLRAYVTDALGSPVPDGCPVTFTVQNTTYGMGLLGMTGSAPAGTSVSVTTVDGYAEAVFGWATVGGENTILASCRDYPAINARLVISINRPVEEFALSLKQGWNLVSSPLVLGDLNTSVFQGTGVTMAARYNRATSGFDVYRVGKTPAPFPVVAGEGYFLYCNEDMQYTFYGHAEQGQAIMIGQGWNLVGWTSQNTSNALEVANSLRNVTMIARYNTTSGNYDVYRVGKTPTPFNVVPGEGYFLYTTYAGPQTLVMG
jgi:hypothetical protein